MPEEAPSAVMRTDPSPLQRRLGSRVSRLVVSPRTTAAVHRVAEWRRRLSGAPHRVAYFHEGVIEELGPPSQVIESPQSEHTRKFLANVR